MKRLICALGLVAIAPVAALAHETEGHSDTGGFKVFGEYLLVRPTLDDTYFVLNSPTSTTFPNGKRENNDFDFESAFRVGAGYEDPETHREFELSYQRLDVDQSETIAGNFLWATVGRADFASFFENYAGTASSDIEVLYQSLDAHFRQPWFVSGVELGLAFGLEWADYRAGEDYLFNNTGIVGTVHQVSRTWGIGPEVGLDLGYELCDECWFPGVFSVNAGSSVALLLSEINTHANNILLGAPTLFTEDDETSRVIPALHARAGFSYAVEVAQGIGASVGLGYQIDSYLRGLTRTSFVDDVSDGLVTTDYYDFSLQGLYVTVGMVF